MLKIQSIEKTGKGGYDMKEEELKEIKDVGGIDLNGIHIMTIIGEIEGHQTSAQGAKTTKYEHLIPTLAKVENDPDIKGVLILINTIGGDVECGLALAELIASLSKPTVSLVLGGSHSIGVPLAVSADDSFIVKSATMMIHPVRTGGTFIGVIQSYRNIEKIQDRITTFISDHSNMKKEKVEQLMLSVGEQVKDVGTILEGPEAVKLGLIDELGGMKEAFEKLKKRL